MDPIPIPTKEEIKEIDGYIYGNRCFLSIVDKQKAHISEILKIHGFKSDETSKISDILVHDLDDINKIERKTLYVYNNNVYIDKDKIPK